MVAGLYTFKISQRPNELEIYIIDLPGTPTIFIRTPNDKRVLINGGSNSQIIRELTKILPFYSRRIDYIIATNTEGKNASGLIDVIDRYKVDKVILPAINLIDLGLSSSTDPIFNVFVNATENVQKVKQGDILNIDKNVELKFLFPAAENDFEYSKASGPEMVIRISHGKNSFLLLGKVSLKIQKFIASGGTQANAAILFQSPTDSNLSREIINVIRPKFLIYRETKEPDKDKTKNIAGIIPAMRFNVYERVIKITSDGSNLEIK